MASGRTDPQSERVFGSVGGVGGGGSGGCCGGGGCCVVVCSDGRCRLPVSVAEVGRLRQRQQRWLWWQTGKGWRVDVQSDCWVVLG